MLDAGEVRLRREGEQVAAPPGRRVASTVDIAASVDAQLGQRRPARRRSRRRFGAGELADAVDRVVVVERQRERATRLERVRLTDELQRAGRVRREDAWRTRRRER